MSTMTLIGKRVAKASTRSTRPSARNASMSSRELRRIIGPNCSCSAFPRNAGATSARCMECSRPSICRIVRPCTGSSCQA